MFVIADFKIIKTDTCLIVESNKETAYCPKCGTQLQYRDTRRRIYRREGGVVDWLLVRRMKCKVCRQLHVELPACVVPYKHYATEVISGVLDGVVSTDDIESENFPAEITMCRWKRWFEDSANLMEEYLEETNFTADTTPPEIKKEKNALVIYRQKFADWLERLFCGMYPCDKNGQYRLWP